MTKCELEWDPNRSLVAPMGQSGTHWAAALVAPDSCRAQLAPLRSQRW